MFVLFSNEDHFTGYPTWRMAVDAAKHLIDCDKAAKVCRIVDRSTMQVTYVFPGSTL
jgi:hypothetical protein